jgi:hypothetical protein
MKLKMKRAYIILSMKNEWIGKEKNQKDKTLLKTQEFSKKK